MQIYIYKKKPIIRITKKLQNDANIKLVQKGKHRLTSLV